MRILLFVVYYFPSTASSAKLIYDLALEFKKMGHSVTVVAPDDSISSSFTYNIESGIEVIRIRTYKIKGAARLLRGFNELILSTTIWRKAKKYFLRNRFDLIAYYSPTIFFGPLIARLKKLYNCSAYLILRDIFPQWAVDVGILKAKGLFYKIIKLYEKKNYDASDCIGVQSAGDLKYFTDNGLDRIHNLEVLYNWMALDEKSVAKRSYRVKIGLNGKIVFFYGGNIGLAQDVDNLLRLAENLAKEPKAHILLVGDGSEVPRVKRVINQKGLTNITIHAPVPQEDYMTMLSEFDVGLISLDKNFRTHNFPGKMLGYMYHSKPILASINAGSDLKNVLDAHQAGLVCYNGEDDIFCEYAIRLVNDENFRKNLGRNARSLLESKFSVTTAANLILSHVKS